MLWCVIRCWFFAIHPIAAALTHLSCASPSGTQRASAREMVVSRFGQNVLLAIAAIRILFNKLVVQKIFRKPPPVNWLACKVLCLGLDGAGKTSLVRHACDAATTTAAATATAAIEPTSGFDVRTVTVPPDVKLEVWEVGGGKPLRPFWVRYVDGSIDGLVWMVNLADPGRAGESAAELATLVKATPGLRRKPLLVLLSQSDRLPSGGRDEADAVQGALGLAGLPRTGPLKVCCTSAADGRGLQDGLQWLTDEILERGGGALDGAAQAAVTQAQVTVERT